MKSKRFLSVASLLVIIAILIIHTGHAEQYDIVSEESIPQFEDVYSEGVEVYSVDDAVEIET